MLVQHPGATNKGSERGTNVIGRTVPPAVLRVNDPFIPEPPSGCIHLEDRMMTPADVPEEEEFQWLQNGKELTSKTTLEKADFLSWGAFQTCHQPWLAGFVDTGDYTRYRGT